MISALQSVACCWVLLTAALTRDQREIIVTNNDCQGVVLPELADTGLTGHYLTLFWQTGFTFESLQFLGIYTNTQDTYLTWLVKHKLIIGLVRQRLRGETLQVSKTRNEWWLHGCYSFTLTDNIRLMKLYLNPVICVVTNF